MDYVSEYKVPLSIIVRSSVGEILNKPDHHLAIPELATHLHRLIVDDIITFTDKTQKHVYYFDDILHILNSIKDTDMYKHFGTNGDYEMGLTPKGGALWELVFKPDWAKYSMHTITFGPTEQEEAEWIIEQSNISQLKAIIALETKYLIIKNGDIHIKKLAPWAATYWKTLDTAYQAYFIVLSDYSDAMSIIDRQELNKLITWWKRDWDYSTIKGTLPF